MISLFTFLAKNDQTMSRDQNFTNPKDLYA